MKRRTVLVGMGGLVAGGGALIGTGAFTTVEAERSVSVETESDASAFLGLEPTTGPNGQEFASMNGDTLEVNIEDVNLNAVTHIDEIFQVTNNGSQPVVLYFEEQPGTDNPDGNAIDVGARTDQITASSVGEGDQPTSNGIVDTDLVDLSAPGAPGSGAGYGDLGVLLGVGDTIQLGFYIDTSDENLNDELGESGTSDIGADELLMEELFIYADATAAENDEYQFESN
jgi:hypothetical protein